jgi:predicted  nucleic acid-binding Zn-ribbon protein
MADTNKTALSFRWGNRVTKDNVPAFVEGSILIAKQERAIYVDAPEGRIRLGDFRVYKNLTALKNAESTGDWSATALYYLEDENALAKWNGSDWVVINDQAAVKGLIAANTSAIGVLEGEVNTLKGKVSTLEGEMDAVEGDIDTLQSDVQSLKDALGVGEDGESETVQGQLVKIATEIENLKDKDNDLSGKITANETAITGKASKDDLNTLSGTVSDLSQTVATNKTDAAAATKKVADDLASYKTLNNAAVEAAAAKAEANELKITALEGADQTLQESINNVNAKFNNYVTTTVYNDKVEELAGDIVSADTKAQKGVDDAATAQSKANEAFNNAAANAISISQLDGKLTTTTSEAARAHTRLDGVERQLAGVGNSTVVALIDKAKQEATYDDSAVRGLIAENTRKVTAAEGEITTLKSNKADKSVVEELSGTVTNLSTTVGNNFTTLDTAVKQAQKDATKANTDLATHINEYNNKVSAIESAHNSLVDVVSTKAAQSDLNDLIETVGDNKTELEGKIGDNSDLINENAEEIKTLKAKDTEISGKVTTLETTVAGHTASITTINEQITALGTADTGLSNRIKAIEDDYLKGADKTTLQNNINTVSGTLNTYKTNNDNRVQAVETDILTVVKPGIKNNKDAIDAMKAGATVTTFKGLEDKIDASFAANDALVFKGVLDTTHGLPTSGMQSGWVYKVAVDGLTVNGKENCRAGDLFIYVDGEWKYIPSGNEAKDEISISSANGVISLGSVQNVVAGSVTIKSGNDSIVVDGSKANEIAISMVWGTF